MFVIKRNGQKQPVQFDKITARIVKLCYGLNAEFVDPVLVSQKVTAGVYKGVTTSELDELAAETAASLTATHPDYAILAARIAISNLHKNTLKSFSQTVKLLHDHVNPKTGQESSLIDDGVYELIMANADRLDAEIIYDRDFDYDYFGYKTLERSYLLRLSGTIVERPQHMLMRVSMGIHKHDIDAACETYNLLSERWFTHASPTLFNAGTPRPQLSSCFLIAMKGDSIEGIYDTLKECACISKSAGGIGLHIHNVRSVGNGVAVTVRMHKPMHDDADPMSTAQGLKSVSAVICIIKARLAGYIRGTNGTSNGIVPMLRVFNDTARYVDQGGGKRKGAFAVYLEPWHADIFDWLDLRKNHGKEESRARDLFYGLWVNDLFMERVERNENWSLFCPNEAPGLADVWGKDFETLYARYENEGRARKIMPAQKLWFAILEAQVETGNPYMLFKDSCNAKSNQQNLGTIKCSNLCTEIVEYTSPEETAVCNLASIALPRFVRETGKGDEYQAKKLVGSLDARHREFDHAKLAQVTAAVTRNLNKIIDVNFYPVETAERSNMRHRPIGLGVQGMADVFILLGLAFDSPEAIQLNKDIFETMYYSALKTSCELAQRDGPYSSYEGSPVSRGILQPDMWGAKLTDDRWNWTELRSQIQQHGILGNNECFEPYTSNIYVRRVLSGEFTVVNQHLLHDLTRLGLWCPDIKNQLVAANGSVQDIEFDEETELLLKEEYGFDMKKIYKTVWEIKQRVLVEMAADRGVFIDQSQSFNVHMSEPNFGKLTSLHFHAWRLGLKTGMYYLRTRAAADAIKFTVDQQALSKAKSRLSLGRESGSGSSTPRAANTAGKLRLSIGRASLPKSLPKPAVLPLSELSLNDSNIQTAESPIVADAEQEKRMAAMICSLENKEACLSCGS